MSGMSEQELEQGEAPAEVVEVPEAIERQPEPEYNPASVELASKYGWKPKDKWQGDASRWVDPERFLTNPITQTRILRDELKVRDKRIEDVERATRASLDHIKRQERERFDAELAGLRASMRDAAQAGDMEQYDALQEREKALKPPGATTEPRSEVHPEIATYQSTQAGWWTHDPELVVFAAKVVGANPEALALGPKKQIEFAERKLREYYPERFKSSEPEPQRPAKVDGGGLAPPPKRGKSIGDLPAEAQAAYRAFKSDPKVGKYITEADYIRQYLGEA